MSNGTEDALRTTPRYLAAREYLERGWSAIPLCPRGKAPLPPWWRQYQERLATPDEMKARFQQSPDANVGIVLGPVSGLLGIDVDGPEGVQLLHQLAGGPENIPNTPAFTTPGGGLRLLFTWPEEGIANRSFRDALGKELLRILGKGCQTVMPPSIHPNGQQYAWLTDSRPGEIDAAPCPAWLRSDAPLSAMPPFPDGLLPPPSPSEAVRRAKAYLAKCEPAISGQGGHNQTFKVACALVHGFHLDDDTALSLLWNEYNPRCVPPWSAKDLRHKVESALKQGSHNDMLKESHFPGNASTNGSNTPKEHSPMLPPVLLPSPPAPPDPAAFHGLAGQLVHAIQPHSEADPVALLIQTLTAFGIYIGRTAHFTVEGDTHYLNLFAALVGTSSKGRKGSSWSQVNKFFTKLAPDWVTDRVKTGLSSAEGLIWAVRDPIWKMERVAKNGKKKYEKVLADAGVNDKRLLCYEPEFASLLKVMERQGNNLSPVLRAFWDGNDVIETLTKHSPAKATGAHVSLIGHVTAEELRRYLSATEQANGFGNRFLWLAVRRSKLLPEAGNPDEHVLDTLRGKFFEALDFARSQGAIDFDDDSRAAWHDAYALLSEGKPGLASRMLARAEAQVRRLACLYAVLDLSAVVRPEHLRAALALWKYVEETVHYVFGGSLGDRLADEILHELTTEPAGLTRDDIRELFNRHRSSLEITRALTLLLSHKLAHAKKIPTGGRPEEHWFAGPEPAP